jgi:hypothetical protein
MRHAAAANRTAGNRAKPAAGFLAQAESPCELVNSAPVQSAGGGPETVGKALTHISGGVVIAFLGTTHVRVTCSIGRRGKRRQPMTAL